MINVIIPVKKNDLVMKLLEKQLIALLQKKMALKQNGFKTFDLYYPGLKIKFESWKYKEQERELRIDDNWYKPARKLLKKMMFNNFKDMSELELLKRTYENELLKIIDEITYTFKRIIKKRLKKEILYYYSFSAYHGVSIDKMPTDTFIDFVVKTRKFVETLAVPIGNACATRSEAEAKARRRLEIEIEKLKAMPGIQIGGNSARMKLMTYERQYKELDNFKNRFEILKEKRGDGDNNDN